MRRHKQLKQLVPDSFGADASNLWSQRLNPAHGFRLDLEAELGRQTYRAQQTQVIFGKTLHRRTDGADQFRFQVRFPANPVVQLFADRIVKEPVDREVAAASILLGRANLLSKHATTAD